MELLAARAAKVAAKGGKVAVKGGKVTPKKAAKVAGVAKKGEAKGGDGGAASTKAGKGAGKAAKAAPPTAAKAKPKPGASAARPTNRSTEVSEGKAQRGRTAKANVSEDAGSGEAGKAAPRGPNAYMLWKQQRWAGLKAENPGLAFKELMRLTSEEWAGLAPSDRQRFEDAARTGRTAAPDVGF